MIYDKKISYWWSRIKKPTVNLTCGLGLGTSKYFLL